MVENLLGVSGPVNVNGPTFQKKQQQKTKKLSSNTVISSTDRLVVAFSFGISK